MSPLHLAPSVETGIQADPPAGGVVNAITAGATGRTRRRVPIADKAVYDLREFWSGTSVPADVVGHIHDGLARSAATGGRVFVPPAAVVADVLEISEPITPTPHSQMYGVPLGFMENQDATTDARTGNWSRIKLKANANCAMLRTDWDNSEGKRGPERSAGQGYNCWNRVDDILLDGNGANQSVAAPVIDIKDAWNFQGRVYVYRPSSWALKADNSNVCDFELIGGALPTHSVGALWLLDSIDCQYDVNVHAFKGPSILFDNTFGCRVSGFVGYAVDEELVRFANGSFSNRLNVRAEQAGKHCIHIESDCFANDIDVVAYDAGLDLSNPETGRPNGSGADQGPWAAIYCDGHHNTLKGSADKRPASHGGGGRFSQSAGLVFGPSAHNNDASALGGGGGLDAGDLIVEYRQASVAAPGRIYSNRSRVPAPIVLPGYAAAAAYGAPPSTASYGAALGNLRHRVATFSATAVNSAYWQTSLPYGPDRWQVHLLTASMGAAGDAVWHVEIGQLGVTGVDDLSKDIQQQWATDAVQTYANDSLLKITVGPGAVAHTFNDLVPHWPLFVVVTRKGNAAADTLTTVAALATVRLVPYFRAD